MGTSGSNGGPGPRTPLVPTWLDQGCGPPPAPPAPPPALPPGSPAPQPIPPGRPDKLPRDQGAQPPAPIPPERPPIPPPPEANRFIGARIALTKFSRSGGGDRRNLGRSISRYVSTASGGARTATQRMGSSRLATGRLASFLSDAVSRGAVAALNALNLGSLAGHSVEDVFLGLSDYVCPNGGTIDEGIARDAFIETIADLAANGIMDFNALTVDQMQTVLELYASHSIMDRLCNDIGAKTIAFPSNVADAERVQVQLLEFIRRGVSDALTRARKDLEALTPQRVTEFVERVYEEAFSVLQAMGDEAAGE